MAVVPLPDTPCLRVRIIGKDDADNDWGTRFNLSYGGSAPTGANCTTIAGDIAAEYAAYLAALVHATVLMTEVDVLDIATAMGASGQWTGSTAGTRSGNINPIQVATNVEYGIAERYRGGKPRGYWPFGTYEDVANQANWNSSFITAVTAGIEGFFTAVEALSVGAVGALNHVLLSYYHGYTNVEVPGSRAYAKPTYRATALHFDVTGYFPKTLMSSQRRRRSATSP